MKKKLYAVIITLLCFACSPSQENTGKDNNAMPQIDNDENPENQEENETSQTYKILALGDSYTIGQSVCASCKFPEQLKDSLIAKSDLEGSFELTVIATTGWTTTNLLQAIEREKLSNTHNLVTLLIGVNNQYQNKAFSIYESEFPQLVNQAVLLVQSNPSKVIVISIPDYAYTPFGNGNKNISEEIDRYNRFAKSHCDDNNITFVNITDITRMGLENPELVAADGLHPSELAYTKFVERILPLAIEKLKD